MDENWLLFIVDDVPRLIHLAAIKDCPLSFIPSTDPEPFDSSSRGDKQND